MASENGSRERRKEAAALALASGSTIRQVSEQVGAGQRTIFRWLRTEAFQRRVNALQRELFGNAAKKLCSLAGKAVDVLGDLLDSDIATVRLKAAALVIQHAIVLRESENIEARLLAIERRLNEGKKQTETGNAGRQGNGVAGQPHRLPFVSNLPADEAGGYRSPASPGEGFDPG